MLLLLLVKAEKLGWELVASADVSAKFNQGPAILGPFRYFRLMKFSTKTPAFLNLE